MALMRTLLLLVLSGGIATVYGRCNPYFGPAGGKQCLRLPWYNDYQWSICLTDADIRQKSGDTIRCQHSPITKYCYYTCMCEVYNGDGCDGPSVRSLCSCNPEDADLTQQPDLVGPLPSWCFSPNGTACYWYNHCLQKQYPCPGTSASNDVKYAGDICNLYDRYKSSFSPDGQAWIAAVNKCLQDELVSVIRPWVSLHVTCNAIKDLILESHSHCFPGKQFCSLTFSDQMNIFWTIKSGLTDTFVDAMKGFWEIVFGCLKQSTAYEDLTDNGLARVKVKVKKQSSMERYPDYYAQQIADAIALNQKWASKGLLWYGFDDDAKKDTEFCVNIVLAQKSFFDLNNRYAPVSNLRDIVKALGNSINGLHSYNVNAEVISITVCNNLNCDKTFLEVTTQKEAHVHVGSGSSFKLSDLLLASIGITVLNIL